MDRRQHPDLRAIAKGIIDTNLYMTLATADQDGRPWASPVYYAPEGYARFYWVSSSEANHSRNIATRAEVAIVVFNSRAPIGCGQGVYVSAVARGSSRAPTSTGASPSSLVGPRRTARASGHRRT